MLTLPFALLLAAGPDAGGDWPQFRGPRRDGTSPETRLLGTWPAAGPPKVWTVPGCGGGYSSVAVVGGVVYGSGLMPDKQEHVWALDAATGKPKWSTPFAPGVPDTGVGGGPRSTPTVSGGVVYAVGAAGALAALDAATGKVLWAKDTVKDFGAGVPHFGFSESVLVHDGKVIITPGAKAAAFVALDARTGAEVWRTKLDRAAGGGGGYSSPVVATFDGVPVVMNLVGAEVGTVFADARTGELLATHRRAVTHMAAVPSPVTSGDRVLVSSGYSDGGAVVLKVGAAAGKLKVEAVKDFPSRELLNHHGGIVVVDDHAYLGHGQGQGHPACVDLKTGAVKWQENRGALGGEGSAATLAADGKLIFRYQNGVVALLKADPAAFTPLGAFKLPDPSGQPQWAHPALARGVLYLRDQDKLHAYRLTP